jgi:hypothetical protein
VGPIQSAQQEPVSSFLSADNRQGGRDVLPTLLVVWPVDGIGELAPTEARRLVVDWRHVLIPAMAITGVGFRSFDFRWVTTRTN